MSRNIFGRQLPSDTLPEQTIFCSIHLTFEIDHSVLCQTFDDCTSGFRCWRRELLARIPIDGIVSDGYAFQVELTWEAFRAGGRVAEVPIVFVERRQGASKMSGRVIVESALLPWRLVASPRTRGR